MYIDHDAFMEGDQLLPGVTTCSIRDALRFVDLQWIIRNAPSAEDSGQELLAAADFREVDNTHLEAARVRLDVPIGEEAMLARINWMWDARIRSSDSEIAARASEAAELMIDQFDCEESAFDAELLASDLFELGKSQPEIVEALFIGDLDDVPDLIEAACASERDHRALVQAAAWMFVCWGALEQQKEACLGWRQLHKPLNDVLSIEFDRSCTIGQFFRPQYDRYELANELRSSYNDNAQSGAAGTFDKRKLNSWERRLDKMGAGWLNRKNEQAIIARFGYNRFHEIPELMGHFGKIADDWRFCYDMFLTDADGKSRAGKHMDCLTTPVSAVLRTAIVCARTIHLGALVADASTAQHLRDMLDAQCPAVLAPTRTTKRSPAKERLRQLFHVIRVELLQDGEHLPKYLRNRVDLDATAIPLQLREKERRKGHETFDDAWKALTNQPADWQFATAFGWQCDQWARTPLRAPEPDMKRMTGA